MEAHGGACALVKMIEERAVARALCVLQLYVCAATQYMWACRARRSDGTNNRAAGVVRLVARRRRRKSRNKPALDPCALVYTDHSYDCVQLKRERAVFEPEP